MVEVPNWLIVVAALLAFVVLLVALCVWLARCDKREMERARAAGCRCPKTSLIWYLGTNCSYHGPQLTGEEEQTDE